MGATFVKSALPSFVSTRRDGTSTATPVAAGIAALLIAYTRQFRDPGLDAANYDNMRKLFLSMSQDSYGEPYRFLAPWSLFENMKGSERHEKFRVILDSPPSTQSLIMTNR